MQDRLKKGSLLKIHFGIRNCASMPPIPVPRTGMGAILAQFRIPICIFNREEGICFVPYANIFHKYPYLRKEIEKRERHRVSAECKNE